MKLVDTVLTAAAVLVVFIGGVLLGMQTQPSSKASPQPPNEVATNAGTVFSSDSAVCERQGNFLVCVPSQQHRWDQQPNYGTDNCLDWSGNVVPCGSQPGRPQ